MDIILDTFFRNPNLPIEPIPGFSDDFNRTANTTSLGRTSREDRDWEYPSGAGWWITSRGTAGVYANSASSTAVVEGYSSNGTLRATLYSPSDTDPRGGLVFRMVDADNFLRVTPTEDGQRIGLYSHVDGEITEITAADTQLTQQGDVIAVQFVDNYLTVTLNGEVLFGRTTPLHTSGTKHGLFAWMDPASNKTKAEWDSIEFIPA